MKRGFSQRLVDEFLHLDEGEEDRQTAYKVLTNEKNRRLVIYHDTGTTRMSSGYRSWCFEDLVLRLWRTMEQIKCHQVKIKNSPHYQLEIPFHKTIEGFGFLDVVVGDTYT